MPPFRSLSAVCGKGIRRNVGSSSKVLFYVLAWKNIGMERHHRAWTQRRAVGSGQGEQCRSPVADVLLVFEF